MALLTELKILQETVCVHMYIQFIHAVYTQTQVKWVNSPKIFKGSDLPRAPASCRKGNKNTDAEYFV